METSNEKKETRGGRRQGAGRKRLAEDQKKTNVTFSLSRQGREAIARYADLHGVSQSQAIESVFIRLASSITL